MGKNEKATSATLAAVLSISSGHLYLVPELITRRLDPALYDNKGYNALHQAVLSDRVAFTTFSNTAARVENTTGERGCSRGCCHGG